MQEYEKLGAFYLGRDVEGPATQPLLLDSRDLVTHAVCVGMTGSGKTGLGIALLEEAALDGVPALVIDPKGDMANLLLAFPELRPEDFLPWIDAEEARRAGRSPEAEAAARAEAWRAGLASWGQGPERVRRLREAVDWTIYTPGSDAGRPVSVVASFAAPAERDPALLAERAETTAGGLLGLLGIDADPLRSREHVLLVNLLVAAWQRGESLDLARLIERVQNPPLERLGVLELESFYPAGERFALAMALNNLLAAPGFAPWLAGEPLDVGSLLRDAAGRPRVAIFSIAHLPEAERMFFVALLLSQTVAWMRGQPGTGSLRALVYMDEVFGYLPPVANPPSKKPLLTLLKQARAYGLGIVLATQNPVDLDYKALSNAGIWFLGRLQTERDQKRVLDGLEGVAASATGTFDRGATEARLAGLRQRRFLLHSVHEPEAVVFETRWVMSFLRGPLTLAEIRRLVPAPEPPPGAAVAPATARAEPAAGATRPVLPPEVPQVFLPASAGAGTVYEPALLGLARVHYADAKLGLAHVEELALLAPLGGDAAAVDWSAARPIAVREDELRSEPAGVASFAPLPAAATRERSFAAWQKALTESLYRSRPLELRRSRRLGLTSRPGEGEREFRARLADAAREARDREVDALRGRYAARVAAATERVRRAEGAVERERQQASQQKLQTAISLGSTVLGAILGRRAIGTRSLGRATTAARGMGRAAKEQADVGWAEENVRAARQKLAELEAELQARAAAITAGAAEEPLETLSVRPRKADVEVRRVALAWVPRAGG